MVEQVRLTAVGLDTKPAYSSDALSAPMRRFVVALAPIRAHCAAVHMLLQSQLREFPLRLKQLEFGLVELTLQALDALRAFATTVQTTLRTRWGSDDI